MIGIYHNRDLDGFTSGAIIKKKYPEAEMRGYDYGEPFDFSGMEGNEVIMADVSLPMKDMIKISKLTNGRFTWIDHHISAIKDFEALNDYTILAAVLDNTIAACEGAWNYLFPGEDMPYAVKLLGEYDTWRNQDVDRWNNEILPFQFGMRVHCNSVKSFPTNIFSHNEFVPGYISDGKLILKYNTIQNETQCRKSSFEIEFKGLKAICLNGGGFNSDVFKSVYDESRHDIMMPFQFNGRFWTVSLYTTKDEVDCSVIAKSMGGGGHKKAAGFQVDDIKTIIR